MGLSFCGEHWTFLHLHDLRFGEGLGCRRHSGVIGNCSVVSVIGGDTFVSRQVSVSEWGRQSRQRNQVIRLGVLGARVR